MNYNGLVINIIDDIDEMTPFQLSKILTAYKMTFALSHDMARGIDLMLQAIEYEAQECD